MMDRNFEDLANGIVLQAVKDYREALEELDIDSRNLEAKTTRVDVESFFRSNWYKELTSLDPEILIEQLKEEIA